MNQGPEHQDPALLDSISNAVIGRLNLEAGVSQQLREMIGGRLAVLWP